MTDIEIRDLLEQYRVIDFERMAVADALEVAINFANSFADYIEEHLDIE